MAHYPATPLPYAPSAAEVTVDPQVVEHAQSLAWETCEKLGSYAGSAAVGSAVVLAAKHFSADGVTADLVKLETVLTRLLGEIEARFIIGVVPDGVEGYLDLLAAYNSLVVESTDERHNLLTMSALQKPIDCFSKTIRENKFTVQRMDALVKRCQTTKAAADRHLLAQGQHSMPFVPLAHGYHPSGSAPWRCPVQHMPVQHVWLYDERGHPLDEKTLKHFALTYSTSHGNCLIAYRQTTRKRIIVHTHKKERINFSKRMSYNLHFDPKTGLAYVRVLFIRDHGDGSSSPAEPPRSAPANWPYHHPSQLETFPTRPQVPYYPPEPEDAIPRPPIVNQYIAQPPLTVGLGESSSRICDAQVSPAYGSYPAGYGNSYPTTSASAGPIYPPPQAARHGYGHAVASTSARPAGHSAVSRPHGIGPHPLSTGGAAYRNNVNRDN